MIRLANTSDLEYFYDLYMHPEVNPFLLYEPMALEEFSPIFQSLVDQRALFIYSAGAPLQNIGMFKLLHLTYRTSHIAYLGGLAIHPRFFGSGHSKKMMLEILDLARSRGVLRLELSTATSNERAIRLYESVGFEREGVLRKYTHLANQGIYLDELLMSWLP